MTTKRVADYMALTGVVKKNGARDWSKAVRKLQAGSTKKSAAGRLEQWQAFWNDMQSASCMYEVTFSTEHDDFDMDDNGDVVVTEPNHQRLLVCQCKRDRARGHCSHKLVVGDADC